MSFISEIKKFGGSPALIESVVAGYRVFVEASNTQIREAIKQGKRIAEADLVDNLPDESGNVTVRRYLEQNPWTADMQGVPREELPQYYEGFTTRDIENGGRRDKTMAEQNRDEIANKILGFEGGSRGYAYLPGIVRIAVEDCLMGSPIADHETLKKLSAFIKLLVEQYDLPNDCDGATGNNPFDRYLNEMTWDEIEAEYGPRIDESLRRMHNDIETYLPDAGNTDHAGEYDIIRVRSFAEAQQYRYLDAPNAPMCIAAGRGAWDQHADHGHNTVYLVKRRDAQDIPPEPGPNAPLDEYGLSAFYVIVDPDGDPVSITPRWNHDQDSTDFSISPRLASDLVGLPFREAFPADPTPIMGNGFQPPPPDMPAPRPRPADRPYQHGWHVTDEYMPARINNIMRRRMGRGRMGGPGLPPPGGRPMGGPALPPPGGRGGRPALPPPGGRPGMLPPPERR